MIFSLSKLIFKENIIAYLSILILLIPKPSLASDLTFYTIFTYNVIVTPFLLLAIYLFLKDKYISAFAIVGLTFNIHALSSCYVIFMFIFYSLLNLKKVGIKNISISIGIFLLMISPLLLWKLLLSKSSIIATSINWEVWLDIMRDRSDHHIFPFSWHFNQWFIFLLYFALWAIALKYAPKSSGNKKIYTFSIAILLLCIIGTIFTEIISS